MIKSIAIILFALIIGFYAQGQTTGSFVGHWKFKEVYKAAEMDSVKIQNLVMAFGELNIIFKADKHYTASYIVEEEGTWHYDEQSGNIVLESDKGSKSEIAVLNVTDKELVVDFGRKKSFVLEKISK